MSVTLAREFASDERVSGTKDLDRDDLRHVSQVIYELDRSLTELQERVIEYYAGFHQKTTAFHRNIAALPIRLCLTSTPDDFLYNALRAPTNPRPGSSITDGHARSSCGTDR